MEHRQWMSRYRDELKGVAILWVIFFHVTVTCTGVMGTIQKIGYGGVDIFFFLTGFGLYHSLRRNDDLRAYTIRRLWRILPAYLPLVIVWMLVMYPSYQLPTVDLVRGVCGNLLMTGFWFNTDGLFNWYISMLFLCLMLAPVFYAFLSRSVKPARTVLCLLVLCFGFGLTNLAHDTYMGAARLPIFVLGMAFAMDWRPKLNRWLVRIGYALCFAVGLAVLLVCFDRYKELLNDYAMYWHPFVLITPPLCVALSWAFHKMEKVEKLFAPLRWIGKSSFEIYLFNIWMVELAKKNSVSDAGVWALLCLANVVLGIAYHLLVEKLTSVVRARIAARSAQKGDA